MAIEPSSTGTPVESEVAARSRPSQKPRKPDCSPEVAQKYFEQGRKLLTEGQLEPACRAFDSSYRCEPAIGTAANLGNCFELLGDSTRACQAWKRVLDTSRQANQDLRARVAEERIRKLGCR